MNAKQIVKLSNIIGITSILLLVYWVFTFIMIQVFGLKVFKENMTETFYFSVFGILALMFGSLIINIMFNLTRIAEKHNLDAINEKSNRLKFIGLLLIFPLLALILFGGDYLTSRNKEKMLIESAKSVVDNNKPNNDKLVNYTFSEKYIKETASTLKVLSGTDQNFPSVTVIVKDSIKGSSVYLGFNQYYEGDLNDTIQPQKTRYIHKTTKEEREYLNSIFDKNSNELRYSASDGTYELFYPYKKNGKTIIIYFSEQQRYGKLGSEMKRMIILFGKIIFLGYTLLFLFYYCAGLWLAIEYNLLKFFHLWVGIIVLALIFLNIKMFQAECKRY